MDGKLRGTSRDCTHQTQTKVDMTDRHAGYVVTLAEDVREDDAQPILEAIRMIKHVASVEPVVSDMMFHMAEERVKHRLFMKMYDAVREVFAGEKPNDRT